MLLGRKLSAPIPLTDRSGQRLGHLLAFPSHDALAIFDQAVVSATRFFTSIIVGRMCGPHELGDYTLGFTIYCIAACVQTGFISQPLTVYGQHLQGDQRRRYAGSTLVQFAALGFMVAVLLGLTAGASSLYPNLTNVSPLIGVLAIAVPLALVVEYARRFAFARLQVVTALAVGMTMAGLQIGGLAVLAGTNQLTASSALGAMGVGGAIAGFTWLMRSRKEFSFHRGQLQADAHKNWQFGRWAVASQLFLVARASAVLWLLALLLNDVATGIFAACDTLVKLSGPLLLAAANVLFPKIARASAENNFDEIRRITRRTATIVGCATALLFVLFALAGERALTLIYGASFSSHGALLTLLALAVVADGLEMVAANGVLALGHSHAMFVINLVGFVFTLAITAALIPRWGLMGAAWGSLLGRCVTAGLMWATFSRRTLGRECHTHVE